MKKTFKGFILGAILVTILTSTALGAGVRKTIEVSFNTVNLTVNGKKVDADTILYKGTTYVPLRAAAEMLGKEVGWDSETKTASINDKKVVIEENVKVGREKYNTDITVEDIARDKDGLKDSFVKFSGKIIQVIKGDGYVQYRMVVNDDYDQIIFIEIPESKLKSNILENDYITVEGVSIGNITYTTVFGSELTIPGISVDNFYY